MEDANFRVNILSVGGVREGKDEGEAPRQILTRK